MAGLADDLSVAGLLGTAAVGSQNCQNSCKWYQANLGREHSVTTGRFQASEFH